MSTETRTFSHEQEVGAVAKAGAIKRSKLHLQGFLRSLGGNWIPAGLGSQGQE